MQMLQANRTVAEQALSFWLLAALLWNSVNVTCDIFCIPWNVTSSVSDDTRGYKWDHLGSWKSRGRYICQVQNATIVRRTNGAKKAT